MQRPRSEHDLHLISGASISAESTQPAQHNTERQLQTEGHGRLWLHLSAFLCCEALKTCGRYPQPGKALGRVRDMSFCHGSAISREQGPKIWQANHHTDGQVFRLLFCGHVPEISLFSRLLVFVSHKTVEGKLLAFPKTYAHARGHHKGARPRAVAAWRSSKSGRASGTNRGLCFYALRHEPGAHGRYRPSFPDVRARRSIDRECRIRAAGQDPHVWRGPALSDQGVIGCFLKKFAIFY